MLYAHNASLSLSESNISASNVSSYSQSTMAKETNVGNAPNILHELYDQFFIYLWACFLVILLFGEFGNLWSILIMMISGTPLKYFKIYFYFIFIVDFLMDIIFGTNQFVENVFPSYSIFKNININIFNGWGVLQWYNWGIENFNNEFCKLSRYVLKVFVNFKYIIFITIVQLA